MISAHFMNTYIRLFKIIFETEFSRHIYKRRQLYYRRVSCVMHVPATVLQTAASGHRRMAPLHFRYSAGTTKEDPQTGRGGVVDRADKREDGK
jgi:hypothetical protein